jgi:cytoskeletal protein CcmA (bactofilin family)
MKAMASMDSMISKTTVIRGHLRGEGNVRIEGEVRGNVEVTGDVELGPGALVSGNISGVRLTIAGTVDGDLNGSEAVVLDSSASVTGDLRAGRIGIAEGAQLRGAVQTDSAAPPRASAVSAMRARPRVEAPPVRVVPKIKESASEPVKEKKKQPPPPVVRSPARGARGRKKSR